MVILTRHGVRSPTWTAEKLNQYSAAAWPVFAAKPGELTAHGRELMKTMGVFYREYLAAHALLTGSGCKDAARVSIWADVDQRTLETGRALSEGLAPGCEVPTKSTTLKDDPVFDPLAAGTAKLEAKLGLASLLGRIGPKSDALLDAYRPAFDTLNFLLHGDGKSAKSIFESPLRLAATDKGVTMEGPLSLASTLSEDFLLEYADGMPQPGWGRLNAANLLQVMALHTAYADLMRRTPDLARARSGNLLAHILGIIRQNVAGTSGTYVAILSGHDTNISNLSGLLGLHWVVPGHQPDDAVPGGALIFSFWRMPRNGRYSVRVQYVAQTLEQMREGTRLSLRTPPVIVDLFVPGCSSGDAGYACDWTRFQQIAK